MLKKLYHFNKHFCVILLKILDKTLEKCYNFLMDFF